MSSPIRFDSAEFAEKDAEEIWREGIDAIFEIQRPKDPPAPFRAKMESWALGGMLLMSHVVGGDVEFQRTRRRIATSGIDHYLVHCLLDGTLMSKYVKANKLKLQDPRELNEVFQKEDTSLEEELTKILLK